MAECKHADELVTTAENSDTDDKQFTCGICFGDYRNPRYLSTCGHTFCENCLLKYTSNIQQQGQRSFDCPVCRKRNKLPENDEVTLQWVQTFPLNTVIIKMMDTLPQSSEETKTEQKMCDPCKEEGETIAGFRFCFDCKEVLCKTCTKYHKKIKTSREHKLIDVAEMSVETRGTADFFLGAGKCTVHPERDVEIYCKSHDAVICFLCSTFQHTACDMTEISGYDMDVRKIQKKSDLVTTRMKTAIGHLEHLQKLKMENKNNFLQKLKAIREDIKQARDQIVELMDNVVSHVTEVTKQIEIEKEDGIIDEMARVIKVKEKMEQNIALLNTIGQHGSDKHKFVSAHLMMKEFEELRIHIQEEDKRVTQLDAKLVLADDLKKLMEITDVQSLLQINVTESESSHTPLASVLTAQNDTGLNDLRDSKLVNAEEHTIRFDGNLFGDDYRGISVCKDGRVIICNYMYGGYGGGGYVGGGYGGYGGGGYGGGGYGEGGYGGDGYGEGGYGGDAYGEGGYGGGGYGGGGYGGYGGGGYDGYLHLYDPTNRTELKLKLTHGKPYSGEPYSGEPYSAVQIDDTHLAVSSPATKTISIVSVGNELREEKTFQTEYYPRTIVALNNGQLAVAWGDPPAFGVVDVSGTELVQISYIDKDTNGREFDPFEYLAVDERRQHVIQPCVKDTTVYCFDFTGNPVFEYTNQGLENPQGVALDRCGNIYVCDYNYNSIHKLSPTGEPISVITEGVPPRPRAVCSDVTGSGFWVTGESATEVVYFRLE